MDLRQYAIFVSIAETGNLTRTAEEFDYTQSGVSHMLKSMEEELGFPLFVRSRRGVKLTASGALLLPYARRLLKSGEDMEQMLSQIRGVQRGRLTVGAFASISMYWMPRLIAAYQKDYPGVVIELREGSLEELDDWLSSGVLDMAFASCPEGRGGSWIPLQEDELMAVVPADFPMTGREAFRLEELAAYPLILMADKSSNDIQQLIRRAGLLNAVRCSSTNAYTMIAMVEAHLGVTILPRLIVDSIDCDYHAVRSAPLAPRAARTLGIALPGQKQLSPAAERFVVYARARLERR